MIEFFLENLMKFGIEIYTSTPKDVIADCSLVMFHFLFLDLILSLECIMVDVIFDFVEKYEKGIIFNFCFIWAFDHISKLGKFTAVGFGHLIIDMLHNLKWSCISLDLFKQWFYSLGRIKSIFIDLYSISITNLTTSKIFLHFFSIAVIRDSSAVKEISNNQGFFIHFVQLRTFFTVSGKEINDKIVVSLSKLVGLVLIMWFLNLMPKVLELFIIDLSSVMLVIDEIGFHTVWDQLLEIIVMFIHQFLVTIVHFTQLSKIIHSKDTQLSLIHLEHLIHVITEVKSVSLL